MLLPQPSEIVPHSTPSAAQVVAVQPQACGTPPPPQVSGALQLPQSRMLLQPSEISPHSAASSAQVLGVHDEVPHWLGPSPPQNSPGEQPPQSSVLPQPSSTEPHSAPSSKHDLGTQLPSPPASLLPPPAPELPLEPAPPSSSALPPCRSSSDVRLQETAVNARTSRAAKP